MSDNGRPPSEAVAAAEAAIAATRRQLDTALADLHRDLALPVAAVIGAAALFEQAGDARQLGTFLRRNALPLALIAVGAAWLGVQNRSTLGELGGSYARDFLDRARALVTRVGEAALSAASEAIGRPHPDIDERGDPTQPEAIE